MNKQRKTSHILNIFQYDHTTGAVTLPAGLSLPTPDSTDNSTKVATTAWIRAYVGSLSYATASSVETAIADLVASAPTTLNTLNELATALGNDPNFATTITTSIGTKVPQSRTITINGTAYDLSADRAWTIASGVTSFNTRTGAITLTSGDVTGALGFTPYNATNPSGYISGITSAMVTGALGYTPYNSSNPSGYITGITSGMVTGALGYTPYNSSNPSGYITSSALTSYALPLSGGTMTGSIVNNTDGAVILESNASENNNWLWKENAKQWGLFWFNRGSQSGQTIGSYTTVGAELMFMGGSSGIAMPSGWTGYIAGSNIAAMISNYNGYIYSASTVYAAGDMRAPIFYDINDTGYYGNFASTSRVNGIYADYIGIGQDINTSYRLITNGSIYLNSNGNGWAEGVFKQRRSGSTFYDVIDAGNIGGQTVAGLNADFLGTGTVSLSRGYSCVLRNENGSGAAVTYAPLLHMAASDTMWQLQGTYGTSGNGTLYFRQGYSGSWGNWLTMLSSANYSSYALPLSGGTLTGTTSVNAGYSFVANGYNNNGGFAMNNGGQYWGLMNNFGTNDWRLGRGSHQSQNGGWNLRWDAGDNVFINQHLYLNNNYGSTIVGAYSSTVYQGIFAMGDAYKLPLNGSSTGSLYGLAWSHPNAGGVAGNLNTHGLLVMENGSFLAAISGNIKARDGIIAGTYMYAPNYIESGGAMYGTIFYDNNDRTYFFDGDGQTRAYRVNLSNGQVQAANNAGGRLRISSWTNGESVINGNCHNIVLGPYSTRTGAGLFYAGIAINGLMNYSGSTAYDVAPHIWLGGYYRDTPGSERSDFVVAIKSGTGTSGAGSDLPEVRFRVDYEGIATATGSFRSNDIYTTGGWFRNHTNNNGIYWSNTGWHIYPENANDIFLRSGTSNIGLRLTTSDAVARGYIYADTGNQVGILTSDRNWALRIDGSKTTHIHGNLIVGYGQTSSNIWMGDTDETQRRIHCNSNRIGFLNSSDGWGAWCNNDGSFQSARKVQGEYLYSDGWVYSSGGNTGWYQDNQGQGIRAAGYNTSYGTIATYGTNTGGHAGYAIMNNYRVILMQDSSGNFGFYNNDDWAWQLFFNRGNNCWGIGTDNTYSGDGFRCVKYGSSQYGWTTWSDRRAKENISSITGALDKVLNMRGVYFNYISDEAKSKRVGFIAQELEQVLPEAVRYAEEIDEYNVEYAQIVSVLAEAIKEQNIKITRLEALVEQLTNN
jgi:hypothetical protein